MHTHSHNESEAERVLAELAEPFRRPGETPLEAARRIRWESFSTYSPSAWEWACERLSEPVCLTAAVMVARCRQHWVQVRQTIRNLPAYLYGMLSKAKAEDLLRQAKGVLLCRRKSMAARPEVAPAAHEAAPEPVQKPVSPDAPAAEPEPIQEPQAAEDEAPEPPQPDARALAREAYTAIDADNDRMDYIGRLTQAATQHLGRTMPVWHSRSAVLPLLAQLIDRGALRLEDGRWTARPKRE